MKVLIAVTGGEMRTRVTPAATTMTLGPPLVSMMMREIVIMNNHWNSEECWNCVVCIHSSQETTDDVACCNCCEEGSFFEEYKDEYTLADLGNNWW